MYNFKIKLISSIMSFFMFFSIFPTSVNAVENVSNTSNGNINSITDDYKVLPELDKIKVISSSNSISITWDIVIGAGNYDIEADGKVYSNVNNGTFTHINLKADSEHTYRIRANGILVKGDWSQKFTAHTYPDEFQSPQNIKTIQSNVPELPQNISLKTTTGAAVSIQEDNTTERVTSVTLNKTNLDLTVGQTETFTATVLPSTASNKAVTWKSSSTTVATVDANGKVKAVGAGSATIACTASDGSGQFAACLVTISSKNELLLGDVNDDGEIDILDYITLQKYIYDNSNIINEKNSDINKDTKINTADLLALRKLISNAETTTISVTSITLNNTNLSIAKGNTGTLTATVLPSTASNKTVTWKSSNTAVVTVDANGIVTAVGAGTTTITCTASDGSGQFATCAVIVTDGTTEIVEVTSVALNQTNLNLTVENIGVLTATITPDNASNKAVTWK